MSKFIIANEKREVIWSGDIHQFVNEMFHWEKEGEDLSQYIIAEQGEAGKWNVEDFNNMDIRHWLDQ